MFIDMLPILLSEIKTRNLRRKRFR